MNVRLPTGIRRDRRSVIAVTLLVALLLSLLPLPSWLQAIWPYWVALVLVYWCLETQGVITVGLAFTCGILLDLFTGSLLGQHALSLVIIIYLVDRFRARLRFFPPWQQLVTLLALLVNDRVIQLWIITLSGDPLPSLDFWLPPIAGTLLWPWLFIVLDRYRGAMRRRSAS
ncbi:MAG: rod shape-determining protein MreD [Xanthomonadales bacterium]|jgi:rod shape-determining protein MreD|nr:rod shape-determining protein MreD [Xanthomonadales bacterium]